MIPQGIPMVFPREEEDALRRVPGRRAPGLRRGPAAHRRGAGGGAHRGEQAPWLTTVTGRWMRLMGFRDFHRCFCR